MTKCFKEIRVLNKYNNMEEKLKEKLVHLGEKITDIKKHLLCIQIGRIYHK